MCNFNGTVVGKDTYGHVCINRDDADVDDEPWTSKDFNLTNLTRQKSTEVLDLGTRTGKRFTMSFSDPDKDFPTIETGRGTIRIKTEETCGTPENVDNRFMVTVDGLDPNTADRIVAYHTDRVSPSPVLCLRGCGQWVSADPHEQRQHWQSGKCMVGYGEVTHFTEVGDDETRRGLRYDADEPVDLAAQRKRIKHECLLEEEQLRIGTTETTEDEQFESWED